MKGGPQPGSGNPGYGKLTQALKQVERLSPTYFAILDKWLTGENERMQLEAMRLMTKFIEKTIPQQVNNDHGGTININISKEIADKYETPSGPSTNSTGQAQV